MNKLGQITSKDCWISATILSFFMVLSQIPSINVNGSKVTFPNGRTVILKENTTNYQEKIIRATRIYFSSPDKVFQRELNLGELEKLGNPDSISSLFFGMKFKVFSTSRFSLYPYISKETIITSLFNRDSYDVFLLTFTFNSSHLYVFSNIEEDLMVEVLDVSHGDISSCKIPVNNILIFMTINLKDIML